MLGTELLDVGVGLRSQHFCADQGLRGQRWTLGVTQHKAASARGQQ